MESAPPLAEDRAPAQIADACTHRPPGRDRPGDQPDEDAATGLYPIDPPVEPMLAKLASELPDGEGVLFEPKWDGFRAIVFRGGGRAYIQSRELRR
jgi:ATP-dependent DNA ligase